MEIDLQRYSPVLYLHTNEKYFPCSFEKYLSKSKLYYNDNLVFDNVNRNNLVQYRYNGEIANGLNWNLRTDFTNEDTIMNARALNDVPIYAYIKEINEDILHIYYIYFFAYNGPYKILFKNIGSHYADIEHITVEVNRHTGNLLRVYYSAHGYKAGMWKNADEIDYNIDGRPIVYLAKGSHASYPKSGTYYRIYGFANDLCNNGYKWTPNIIKLSDAEEIVKYNGTWGFDSVRNMSLQKWWQKENEISCKWWKRVFLPWTL